VIMELLALQIGVDPLLDISSDFGGIVWS
jgi:hypothetical protein